MSLYAEYLKEIETREMIGLQPKPIEDGELLGEIIEQIRDKNNKHRDASIDFFIYNTLPGTTRAAANKAKFLKEIILGDTIVEKITPSFAFDLLSHMKGGASIEVLLDLAFGDDDDIAKKAAKVIKTQVFLYEADTERLKKAYLSGNTVAKDILESYAQAEFFTALPDIDEKIKVVTFVAAEGDISTDLLSPGNQAHSRADRELHGKSFISEKTQKEIRKLQAQHPDKRVMLIAEKGTMGVGSSRMSGVNNVALWTGKQASPYVPFVNYAPIVAGTNGISPIFMTTVGVTGGIGIDLRNWVKKLDADGNPILNNDGSPVLEEKYSVETGTILTIDTKKQKLNAAFAAPWSASDSADPMRPTKNVSTMPTTGKTARLNIAGSATAAISLSSGPRAGLRAAARRDGSGSALKLCSRSFGRRGGAKACVQASSAAARMRCVIKTIP